MIKISGKALKAFVLSLPLGMAALPSAHAQQAWTLQQCIDYAMEHSITLQQNRITSMQNDLAVLQSKAALFPSLSFSTNQNASWRPYSQSTINLTNGTMTTTQSTVNYNGSYGLNASMTVWNGGRNTKAIRQNEYTAEMSELNTEKTANTLQEQIAQLYVQILYQTEAVRVNQEILKAAEMQRDRAQEMVNVGSLAKVDLMQLQAQTSQDEYNVINAKSQLENYKLQLKQLLELDAATEFNIVTSEATDQQVLAPIPTKEDVFGIALAQRPEIQSSKLNVESSDLAVKVAKAGYLPQVNVNASMGTSNASGMHKAFGEQVKTNLSNSIGMSISVPIFDQRQNRTNVQKAKLTYLNSQLQLQDAQKTLYSTIESYWLNATTSQQQYVYAKANVESMQASYDLVTEQFRLGLKNIVELTTGKTNLMQAEQQLLQSKYNTLYNLAMLRFYQGERIHL
ncbi:MAG: TolC family protein [Bacteroidaceae bacterium]|nr:TolC family protein [Bacteroidaceae bacterium]